MSINSNLMTFTSDFELTCDNLMNTYTTNVTYLSNLDTINDYETITITYRNNFQTQISKALLFTFELTSEQLEGLSTFMSNLALIERACNCEFDNISITSSIENEILLTRKSLDGVTLIAIDEDGDVFFNFTGYKQGFIAHNYPLNETIDWESLVYQFLSK